MWDLCCNIILWFLQLQFSKENPNHIIINKKEIQNEISLFRFSYNFNFFAIFA